jgi:DNA-binding phage protein
VSSDILRLAPLDTYDTLALRMDIKKHIDKLRGKRTLAQFARDIGVTRQTLYNAINDSTELSERVLRALGLTRSYRKE